MLGVALCGFVAAEEAGQPTVEPEAPENAVQAGAAVSGGDYAGLWRRLGSLREKTTAVLQGAVEFRARMVPQMPVEFAPNPDLRQAPQAADLRPRGAEPARAPGVVELVGRPGEARIVEGDGTERTLSVRELTFINQPGFRMSDMPQPTATPFARGMVGRQAEPGAPTPEEPEPETQAEDAPEAPETSEKAGGAEESAGDETSGQPAQSAGKDQAKNDETAKETTAEKEARQAKLGDVERIKGLRKDSAWFYNPDGTPMTRGQLDARIASGDIEGVRAVDRYQQSWSAKPSYDAAETETTTAAE